MAEQAKTVANQLKSTFGGQYQPSMPETNVPATEAAVAQEVLVPDASGRAVIQSEGHMVTWLNSLSEQTKSPVILRVINAQLQVIQFVKAPSLLGMVLDNMIAVLYQTLRESSSEKEKVELRETISLMIQNLIFFADAQLHYAIDQNKQEAKQLLSTAGDMLSKSVAAVASLAGGPAVVAGVIIKNIFASEEMQNGFFGKLIGWIMDRGQIEKRIEDFDLSLKNLFDTFDKYASLIGASIQIHGMLHRYERVLAANYKVLSYATLYQQFTKSAETIFDDWEYRSLELFDKFEALLSPLEISERDTRKNQNQGLITEFVEAFVGPMNGKKKTDIIFCYQYLCDVQQVFEPEEKIYKDKIESLEAQITSLSFIHFSQKKDLEKQKEAAEKELAFCQEVLKKLNYYKSKAKTIEDNVQSYTQNLANITAKFSLNAHSAQGNNTIGNINDAARQKFNKMFDLALADGEISEKEKGILWKYAEAAGIDEGEFELMVENKANII